MKKNVAGVISCAQNVARLKNKMWLAYKISKCYGLAHFLGVILKTLLFSRIFKS